MIVKKIGRCSVNNCNWLYTCKLHFWTVSWLDCWYYFCCLCDLCKERIEIIVAIKMHHRMVFSILSRYQIEAINDTTPNSMNSAKNPTII